MRAPTRLTTAVRGAGAAAVDARGMPGGLAARSSTAGMPARPGAPAGRIARLRAARHAPHALLVALILPAALLAQTPPAAAPPPAAGTAQAPEGRGAAQGRGAPAQGRGPNFPQQQRKLADAAVLARGKGLYESSCAACHGIDLRGGQQGGPNLLRSQTLLSDQAGELIAPIITGGRPNPPAGAPPMPAFPLPPADITAVAEYLHSVLAQAGNQGRPPEGALVAPEQALVGNATAGQGYVTARCVSCHALADLKSVAARATDPRDLQNQWVAGGSGGGRGGRGGAGKPIAVTVTPASGPPVQGRLVRIDDFVVSMTLDDGTRRTFARNGADPKVEMRDPAAAHRTIVAVLADRDMHDVTAYLWSLR
jgi:cytochrome c oxidase cbb3-type subunit 3